MSAGQYLRLLETEEVDVLCGLSVYIDRHERTFKRILVDDAVEDTFASMPSSTGDVHTITKLQSWLFFRAGDWLRC